MSCHLPPHVLQKRTLFVSNVEFTIREDDLKVFFQGSINEQRRPSQGTSIARVGDASSLKLPKLSSWIKSVRIGRDPKTGLSKGFAFVELVDAGCVDIIMGMHANRLELGHRRLDVKRYSQDSKSSARNSARGVPAKKQDKKKLKEIGEGKNRLPKKVEAYEAMGIGDFSLNVKDRKPRNHTR